MAIKTNIFANYVSFAYVSAIGVLITPLLYRLLGPAGYGVIGFYALLQAWFVLLDFGLSAALSRTCSRYKGGAVTDSEIMSTFRVVERVFVAIGLVGALALGFLSNVIADVWFGLEGDDAHQVSLSLLLVGFVIALRWLAGLYRAVLNGFEKQVWISIFGSLVATLRFPVAFLIISIGNLDVVGFFWLQLVIAIGEVVALRVKARKELPKPEVGFVKYPSSLKDFLGFSSGIFVIAITNTAILQVDKLVISKSIGLAEFGKFSLMMMLVNVIGMVSGPISSALIPALSRAHAERRLYGFYTLYTNYWQICVIAIGVLAIMMSVHSQDILYLWTGDATLSAAFGAPFRYYVIGNATYALAAYVHYVQFAAGDVRLQLKYNLSFLVLYMPIVLGAVLIYGLTGAAIAWASCSIVGFFYITHAAHCKFMRPQYALWMKRYFMSILIPMLLLALMTESFVGATSDRVVIFFELALITITLTLAGMIASSKVRRDFAKLGLFRSAPKE